MTRTRHIPARDRCLPPVWAPDARLLMLGSLPGGRSLAESRYYAHPRNQFWRLMEAVIDAPLAALAYDDRLAALRARGVALWDTVAEAARPGSLDSAMTAIAANDVAALAVKMPGLRAVGLNGGLAARLGAKALAGVGVALVPLPSSSPALTWPFERKRAAWLALRAHL